MSIRVLLPVLALLIGLGGEARAGTCHDQLRSLGVDFKAASKKHIEEAVEVRGPLGGVTYLGYRKTRLIIACELAVALAKAGRYLTEQGVVSARYSSAYSRRRIRTSGRWSRHAYGRAIDVHSFTLDDGTVTTIKNDYEQGLGDDIDCVGRPLTREGRILRTLACQFERSGLFDNVLDPDYDAHHYNHFHLDIAR
jgi:hypothetical protein